MDIDTALADALLRYRVTIERVGLETAHIMAADIEAALAQVKARITVGGVSPRLAEVRRELAAAVVELRAKIEGRVGETIDAITGTAPAAIRQALAEIATGIESGEIEAAPAVKGAITGALAHRVPIDRLAQIGAVPFDGKSWTQWGAKLAADTHDRIESEARQWFATGDGIDDLRKRITTATGMAKTSADRLARTLASDISARASQLSLSEFMGSTITGWRWVSTLDGRTSPQCRALDGKEWRAGEHHPRPPQHPNCRSILVPISKLSNMLDEGAQRPWSRETDTPSQHGRDLRRIARERIGVDRWRAMSEPRRRTEITKERDDWNAKNVGKTSAGTTYSEWIKRQPESFQRDVLGAARFDLFKKGIPLSAMVTPDFSRPLTVAELRARFSE
jgi:SPP1 gp7 family putative phage head morphogenesis protein